MKRFLSLAIIISFLLLPSVTFALELDYPTITIPGVGEITLSLDMDLNTLVAWFYYFIVGIAGISAFVMLVWGGVQWLTSAGSPAKVTDAKDRISTAFFGLLIILASWLILQVINPDLTTLNLPQLP
jgi:hypothetical protein